MRDVKGERKIYHWLLSTAAYPEAEETRREQAKRIRFTGVQNLHKTPPTMDPSSAWSFCESSVVAGEDVVTRGKRNSSQWSIKTASSMI